MAGATRTLRLVLQLDTIGSYKEVASSLRTLQKDAAGAGGGVRELGQDFGTAEKQAGGFFSRLAANAGGALIASGISAITSSIGGLVSAMIGGNAQFETYNAQFASLMGSTDAAKAKIDELSKFAATTPFELPDVITASKNLLTFGGAALNTEQNMKLVGNAAAASGADIERVSFWVGRAYSALQNGQPFGDSAMELQQLGILSGEARLKLEALQKTGAKGPEMWAAFQEGLTAPTDAMDKLSKTWTGMMSTLKDTTAGALRTIGAPIFELLKSGLEPALAWLSGPDVQGRIAAFGQNIANGLAVTGRAIGSAIDTIKALVQGFTSPFEDAWTDLETIFASSVGESGAAQIIGVFERIRGGLGVAGEAIDKARSVIAGLINTIKTGFAQGGAGGGIKVFLDMLSKISPAFVVIRGAVESALPAIQSIITSVFGMISGFVQENGASIVAFFQSTWERVQGIAAAVLPPIQSLITTVFGAVATFLQTHGAEIQALWTTVWQTMQAIISGALDFIQAVIVPALTAIAGFISDHSSEIQAILSAAWQIIKSIIEGAMGIIRGVIATVTALIHGDWAGAWEGIKLILSSAWEAIKGIVSGALDVLKGVLSVAWDAIKTVAGAAWNWLKDNIIAPVWDGINSAVSGALDTLKGALSTAWDTIKGAAQTAWDGIAGTINGIWGGVVGGVKGAVNQIIGVLNTMIDAANTVASAVGAGTIANIPELARGTRDWLGGAAVIGERGPELVGAGIYNLKRGMQVLPAPDTARLLQRQQSGLAGDMTRQRQSVPQMRRSAPPMGVYEPGRSRSPASMYQGSAPIVQAVPGMVQIIVQGGDPRAVEQAVSRGMREWEQRQAAETRAALRGRRI